MYTDPRVGAPEKLHTGVVVDVNIRGNVYVERGKKRERKRGSERQKERKRERERDKHICI